MIDISVKNLTKFFVIGENLLEGLSFDIQEGECVAVLGRNGCGKTTLFKILTGEMDYDDGEVFVNPHKRIGLISQIPVFPEGYTVEQVLRSAYAELDAIHNKMIRLEQQMASTASSATGSRAPRGPQPCCLPFLSLRSRGVSLLLILQHKINEQDQNLKTCISSNTETY